MSQSPPKNPEDTDFDRTIPDLTLEDTAAQRRRGLAVPGPAPVAGYNPYNTVTPGQPAKTRPSAPQPLPEEPPPRKRTDLRKLSEWIRAQRLAEATRQEAKEAQEAQERAAKEPDPPRRK